MNKQRQAVYGMRRKLLEGVDQKERVLEIIARHRRRLHRHALPGKSASERPGIWTGLADRHPHASSASRSHPDELQRAGPPRRSKTTFTSSCCKRYQEKEDLVGPELMRETERMIMLNVIDNQWKDHLLSMDHLKEGIGLRGYGQKDPLIEYKKESFDLFQDMMDRIEDETVRFLFFMQRSDDDGRGGRRAARTCRIPNSGKRKRKKSWRPSPPPSASVSEDHRRAQQAAQNSVMDLTRTIQRKKEKELAALQFVGGDTTTAQKPVIAKDKGVGRNDPALRQREEVQEMPRSLKIRSIVTLAMLAAACAAQPKPPFSPTSSAPYRNPRPRPSESRIRRSTTSTVSKRPNPPTITSPDKKHFSATAWRLHDSTGALALFEFPAAARRDALGFCSAGGSDLGRHHLRLRELCVPIYRRYVPIQPA